MSKRALYAGLAWAAATATAMAVVWAGLESVLSTATGGPHVAAIAAWPVPDAATAPVGASVVGSVLPVPVSTSRPPSPVAHTHTGASGGEHGGGGHPAESSSPPARPLPLPAPPSSGSAGSQRRYSTPGGTVVLTVGPRSATLDAATPAPGFTVQSWHGDGFLEVLFSPSDAGTAYEVIATWAGTSPVVQTVTAGG